MQRITISTQTLGRVIARSSLVCLACLFLFMLCPVQSSSVNAALPELTEGQSSDQAITSAVIHLQSTISLALTNRVSLDIIPKAGGNFSSSSATIAVATNNSTGYGIFMNTLDGTQSLNRTDNPTGEAITPVTGQVSSNNFPANTWGYKLTSTEDSTDLYQAVPSTTTKVKHVDTKNQVTEQDTFSLDLGVNVNTQLSAGTYQNGLMISVVANPRTLVPFLELTYMQEMDTQICTNATVGDTKQLIDLRDNKSYWVAKLADNNCWMTQNLALDLDENTPLTPALSDVSTNWVPKTTETNMEAAAETNDFGIRSWNLGKYVLATPLRGNSCGSQPSTPSLSACLDFQLVDDSWTYEPAKTSTWNGYSGIVAADAVNKTYDTHYLIGNYYQWSASVAGDSSVVVDGNATSSICPKAWRLPTQQQSTELTTAYNITDSSTGNIALVSSPLFFVRDGYMATAPHALQYAGAYGGYWLSSIDSNTEAFSLYFGPNRVYLAYKNYRQYGFSVRCIAR